MKNILLSLGFLLSTFNAFTQPCLSGNEQNIWYFGANAGLNFNSSVPTALSNGQINNAEECASIADSSGQLLMYTNGLMVWNANHQIMQNGTGLLGNPSTTQGAVIIPMPLTNDKYYLFTIDDLAGPDGFRYSIVDMSLDGGLGGVVVGSKNILIQTNVSEKLATVRHCNKKDIWVIVHDWASNLFRSYLITEAGIQNPVLTNIGVIHIGGNNYNYNTVGCMKISPDGRRLALGIRDMYLCQLFDFDTNTGIISNAISLSSPNYSLVYGVEFSSDNSKLYITAASDRSVYQFNLLAGDENAINASSIRIGQTTSNYVFSLQRATNGKIYVARANAQNIGEDYLGVINEPNVLGMACNYVDDGVFLEGAQSLLGLPNFMIDNIDTIQIDGPTSICLGDTAIYNANKICSDNITYAWTYTGLGNISNPNEEQTNIVFNSIGNEMLILRINSPCGTINDTIIVNIQPCPAAPPPTADFNAAITQTCVNNCLNFTDQSTESPTTWLWTFEGGLPNTSTDQNPNNICYEQADMYTVQLIVTNNIGSDTLLINNYISIIDGYVTTIDTTICAGDSLLLQGQYQYQAGTYYDTLANYNACDSIVRTKLALQICNTTPCAFLLPNAFSPNGDNVNDTFLALNNCVPNKYDFWVYNLWGEQVFHTTNWLEGWDGTYKGIKQEMGVYACWVQCVFAVENGTEETKTLKGNVTLIR